MMSVLSNTNQSHITLKEIKKGTSVNTCTTNNNGGARGGTVG
jgi:hypothetical protein